MKSAVGKDSHTPVSFKNIGRIIIAMIKNTILLKEEIRFESFVIPLDCKYEILIKFAP